MFERDHIRLDREEGANLSGGQCCNEDIAAPNAADHIGAYKRPTHEPPRDQIETLLAEIWEKVLGVRAVGRHDNFFALGGDSLLAVRAANRVQSVVGIELPLSTFFAQATLAELSERILEMLALRRGRALKPITPISRKGRVLCLSSAQQRLWRLSQLDRSGTAYQLSVGLRLKGSLDIQALRRSFDQIFSRHDALRTVFVMVDGQPRVQVLSPAAGMPWLEYDLRSFSDPQAELERLRGEEACTPFDLSRPLIRSRLIRIGEDEYFLLLTQHQIVSDADSLEILLRELSVLYHAFIHKQPDPLPLLAIQFPDYAAAEAEWLASDALPTQSRYWQDNRDGAPAFLTIPTDRPRPPQQPFTGANIWVSLDAELTHALKRLSQRYGTTLFMTLLTAWATVLARLSGQDNLLIGITAANRGRQDIEDLVGSFASTLPLCIDLSDEPTVGDLLTRVRTTVLNALEHQKMVFELSSENGPPGHLDPALLFQVVFAWHNADGTGFRLPGLTVESVDRASGNTQCDLKLSLRDTGNVVEGVMIYSEALFDACTVKRYRGYFVNLLRGMVDDGVQPIMGIEILDDHERELLLNTWNQTEASYPRHLCIHQLFEERVHQDPESAAVVFEDQSLTYRELNVHANHLARHLIALGVKPNDRVAICADRRLGTIVGLLAILKAGGAYVPLDLGYPAQGLGDMLRDAAPIVVLADAGGRKALDDSPIDVPVVDLDQSLQLDGQSELNLEPQALGLNTSHLAYVIYTSGSTGTPKGVMVSHRQACARLTGLCSQYGFCRRDRVLQFWPISSDGSVEEIFCTLLSGSALVLRTDAWLGGATAFWTLCGKYRLTVLDLPTRFWQQLVESQLPDIPESIRLVVIGGEAVSHNALERWYRASDRLPKLLNSYGPTETTIVATVEELDRTVPYRNSIGRPIANTRIYLLDAFGRPVPLGVAGEIYIGGEAVAQGYLNKVSLTAVRFLEDPFSPLAGSRMYRTGDRGRYLASLKLEFLGRNDRQIKVRGFRVEPGEVEAHLTQNPFVREAAVIARKGGSGDASLVAYITLNQEPPQGTASALRSHLSAILPEYMVPAAFVALDSFPLMPNGKLDYKLLPDPDDSAYAHQVYEPPQGPIETAVAEAWAKLLGLERVGRHDDFFALGGHSLLAVKMISQVRLSMATDVRLLQIIGHSTVSSFALSVLAGQKDADSSLQPRSDSSGSPGRADPDCDEHLFNVRLPFELNVPLRTFLSDAYPLGILWKKTSFREWFLHFNVNLAFRAPEDGFDGIPLAHHLLFPVPTTNLAHWREMGFLDFHVYDFEFVQAYDDNELLRFLSSQVREGRYLLVYGDEYYLSRRDRSTHIRHETLIVGLSEETGSFLTAAYDEAGEYKFMAQRFEAVIRALKSPYTDERPFLISILPKEDIPQAEVAPDLIGRQIDDYLNSRPSATQYPWIEVAENWRRHPVKSQLTFGLACYDEIARYLAFYFERPKEIDPRCTRLLWEHKKLLALRVDYLADAIAHPALKDMKLEYKEVEKTARLVHQLACVGYMSEDGTDRVDTVRLRELLSSAKRTEERVLGNVRDALFAKGGRYRAEGDFTADERASIKRETGAGKLHPLEVILSKRKLRKAIGNEAREWADCLVTSGYESLEVRTLANLESNLYPPLIEPYVDRVLKHLGISGMEGIDALIRYCRHLIDRGLEGEISAETLYARLMYVRRQHESSYRLLELDDLSTLGRRADPLQRSLMIERLKALALAYQRTAKIETKRFSVGPLFTDLLFERQRDLWAAEPGDGHTIDICKNTLLAAEDSIARWHCCPRWQRKLSNKLNAKEFATKLGVKVARLYWHGKTAEALPFNRLPGSFVLKATTGWNAGSVLPIADGLNAFTEQAVTEDEIRSRLSTMLAHGRRTRGRIEDEDSGYDDATIFAEEFLRDRSGPGVPDDYKCFCFSGRVAYIQVIRRSTQVWYTPDWNVVQDAMLALYTPGTPTAAPENLDDIIAVAQKLSAAYEYPFVRVDLYNTVDGVYFGEFTHTPYAGMSKALYTPHANETMGRYWFDALA
jgi:amino acid adenylation domain-containing protein